MKTLLHFAFALIGFGCATLAYGIIKPRYKDWKRNRLLNKAFAIKINDATNDEEKELGI